jgi:hypothetical protein
LCGHKHILTRPATLEGLQLPQGFGVLFMLHKQFIINCGQGARLPATKTKYVLVPVARQSGDAR